MTERMFGVETEYSLTVTNRQGERVNPEVAAVEFLELAKRYLPYLPGDQSAGIFLGNGSRLYVDCRKPELATPECSDPWTLCRYFLAGNQILNDLAARWIQDEPTIKQVLLTTANVSYAGNQTTWAAHESYGHRAAPATLAEQLIPHLVSRLIFSGGGGFDSRSPGIQFMLSPRVAHLNTVVSGDSTSNRPIFHTKNEPLNASGFHRLHVLCGDGLCSEVALWMKLATTALVVALIEGQKNPGQDVELKYPLRAMQVFATDLSLSAVAEMRSGNGMTAIDIQQHYLDCAERHKKAAFMPRWAAECCDIWRATLDRLRSGPAAVQITLDWAIKLALYGKRMELRGIDPQTLPHWNAVLEKLQAALVSKWLSTSDPKHVTAEVLAPRSPIAAEVRSLTPWLAARGLSWDQLPALLALRLELFEIDTRFGQLDDLGIFQSLNRAGVLDHHVSGVDNIRQATVEPPAVGRARLRGQCVQRFSGQGAYRCEWSNVWDYREHRCLDLSDPFAEHESWRDLPPSLRPGPDSRSSRLGYALSRALALYDRGSYESAAEWLQVARQVQSLSGMALSPERLRYTAWVQARRGFLDAAASLDQLAPHRPLDLVAICDYVCVYRFQGLRPAPEIGAWINRGLECLAVDAEREISSHSAFLAHCGYKLLCDGRAAEALERLTEGRRQERFSRAHPRCQGRLLSEQAEAVDQLGDPAEALRLLDAAARVQTEHSYEGDLADFTLTRRAKIAARSDTTAARELLAQVKEIQTRHHNAMGEVRTLLLEARLPLDARHAEFAEQARRRILELRAERPALAQCRLLEKILVHWQRWTGGEQAGEDSDYFWRL